MYIPSSKTDFFLTHSGLKMSKKCKQIILKVRICVGQYPTQLTVTLQNCRKIWSSIFVTFLVFFALFFANSFTVMVALVAKPLVLPSQWTLLQKIVQKTLEMWLKLLQTFLQFSNVTVSCVKYHSCNVKSISQKICEIDFTKKTFLLIRIYYDIPYAWLLSEGNGWIMVDIYIIWVFYSIAYFWSF